MTSYSLNKTPNIQDYVFLPTTGIYDGNDHNYYTNSKSRLGSLCLLTEVALGKGSGAWNQSLIVSPGGWSHLSTHQCLSPRKIRKMPIWDEKGFWKHVTSSKHSRSNATCFIKTRLSRWIQKKVPRTWIMGADFESHARTRNGNMGRPHKQHSEPRSWMAPKKQPETGGTEKADIEKKKKPL